MPALADCVHEPARTAAATSLSAAGHPHLNPLTGLSTDYLNHFTEALMVLEMAGVAPECLDDLRAWTPKTYTEHFAASAFSARDAVIAAYRSADPARRDTLDKAAERLNRLLSEARDTVVSRPQAAEPDMLTQSAVTYIRPLIARMGAIINGHDAPQAGPESAQAAIDAMFEA